MVSRIVIADDHPLVLEGLAALIRSEADFQIVATAGNGGAAVAAIAAHRPELAVIDLRMPERSGLAVLRELQGQEIQTRVVLLAASASDAEVYDCMQAGAAGLIFKEAAGTDLLQCLRAVASGAPWRANEHVDRAARREGARRAHWEQLASTLTPRELEIVQLLVAGDMSKQIAFELGVSEGTLKVHLNNIFRKLNVSVRGELIVLAAGLVGPPAGRAARLDHNTANSDQ